MPDCRTVQALLQRTAVGTPVSDEELRLTLDHLSTCGSCGLDDLVSDLACAKVEAELPSYAHALHEGEDPAAHWPALTQHLGHCERCAEVLADLIHGIPTEADSEANGVDPSDLFEHALVAGLSDPDPLVRRRAAARLGAVRGLRPTSRAALVATVGRDPDERVRTEAVAAITRLGADGRDA